MPLPPSVVQKQGVQHTNDPETIIDYPAYLSIVEWGGAQSSAFGVSPPTSYAQVGTGVSDDSAAVNAALAALIGSGITLYFPSGTYLLTANAIVNTGNVPIMLAPGAVLTGTYASTLLTQTQPFFCKAVMTTVATSTTYTGSGTNTLTFGSSAAIGTQDGVTTLAAGDCVLLQGGTLGSCAITAKDTGPWIISNAGGASAKVVLVRPSWWQTGMIVPQSAQLTIGLAGVPPTGTFGGTKWSAYCTAGSTVIGTTDPQFYPDKVSKQITLASSTLAVANIPIFSATGAVIEASFIVAGGTVTNTVGYGVIAAPTAGYVGTCTFTVDALASGMGKNGTADASTLGLVVINRAS